MLIFHLQLAARWSQMHMSAISEPKVGAVGVDLVSTLQHSQHRWMTWTLNRRRVAAELLSLNLNTMRKFDIRSIFHIHGFIAKHNSLSLEVFEAFERVLPSFLKATFDFPMPG